MIENEEYTEVRLPARVFDCIEKTVVSLFKRLDIKKVPIKPFEIASKLGFIVKKYSSLTRELQIALKTSEHEGLSHFDPDLGTFVIYYDDSISYSRIRFTIMHEIGHITLGHREESVLAKRMADYFAAYSLAPSPLIKYYNCEDYSEVVDRFDVSLECAYNSFSRYLRWTHQVNCLRSYENELLDLFL